MTNTHSQDASRGRQNHFVIPQEIRLHPKLDQATKFAWVYIWEQSNFRPDTIVTTIARIAADLGKSERAARRWIQCLAEAGLIEMVNPTRRGECVFYVNPPVDWEGTTPPPSVHKLFGTSVPDLPNEKEDCGGSVPDPPNSPPPEEKEKFILDRERAENAALQLIIEKRRAQMPRDSLGISGDGTEVANCQQSRDYKSLRTVNSLQVENPGNAVARPPEPPPPDRGPLSVSVSSVVKRIENMIPKDHASTTELTYDATFQWLRVEWPNQDDVYIQLLHRCAQAVAFGHLSKEKLFDLVKRSKADRIEKPANHFCSTIRHYLPSNKKQK